MSTSVEIGPAAAAAVEQTRPPARHFDGLDGLRGFAVLAVLVFHQGFSWGVGGYLGVSLFFTLSGFLICGLLVREGTNTGRIRLGQFWIRRFRRLLPAALIGLCLIVLYGALAAPPAQRLGLGGDIRAALFDVSNWRFLSNGHDYANIFSDPSPVQHYWSLSIEEQFYLVFPLLVAFVFWLRGRSLRLLAVVLCVLAAGSIAVQLTSGDPDRIYYGTDARAFELLTGALLAIALAGWINRPRLRFGRWTVAAAVISVIAAVIAVYWWSHAAQTSSWLYDGGFVLVALVNVALVMGAMVPGPVRSICSLRAMRYIGRISYGLYLYHWPVFLWLNSQRTGLEGVALFALRLAVTFAIAAVSFRFVEWPIRTGQSLKVGRILPAFGAGVAVVALLTVFAVPAPDASQVITADDFRVGRKIPEASKPPAVVSTENGVPQPLRVYVAGDSTAVTTAGGLGLWSLANGAGKLEVKTSAGLGCAFQRHGRFRAGSYYGLVRDANLCDTMPDHWARDIAEFQPDVILVVSGPFNTIDFMPAGDTAWRAIGDPVYDEALVREMQQAVDILGSTGKPIIWFDLPYSDRDGWNVPARTDAYNAYVQQIAAEHPEVVRLGWANDINPMTPDQRWAIRPDGVHVDPKSMPALLDDWLWDQIVAKYRVAQAKISASAPAP